MQLATALQLTPPPDQREKTLAINALNSDIMRSMAELVPEATSDVLQLAKEFKKDTAEKTAFAIWHFLRTRAKYVRDSSDLQQIRLPRRFIHDTAKKQNSGDCKSFALLTVALLRALGMPAFFKYAGYLQGKEQASHVYALTTNEAGAPIIIDGCYPFFNREKKHFFNKIENMTVTSLSGLHDSSSAAAKAKAKLFLASLPPAQRQALLQVYKRRCRLTRTGKKYMRKPMRINGADESYPILGVVNGADESYPIAADESYPIAADESQPIARRSKAERKERRKKFNEKVKKGWKKFGKGLLFGVAFINLLPIRAAFCSIVAMNVNSFAHNLRFIYRERNGKLAAEWKKIAKIWQRLGGIEKALLKAIELGAKHKPLFLSKKAKSRFEERKKNTQGYSGCRWIGDTNEIGNPAIIAAAIAAASGIIAAMIPVIMQGLKKGGKPAEAAQVQEEAVQMVDDYKRQGSPAPAPYTNAAPGEDGSDGSQEQSEDSVDGLGAFDFSALTKALGDIATVGIQTAGAAVALKRKRSPNYDQMLTRATPGTEQYLTGQYLQQSGDGTGASAYPKRNKSASGMSTKTMLLIGGGLAAAVAAIFAFTRGKK